MKIAFFIYLLSTYVIFPFVFNIKHLFKVFMEHNQLIIYKLYNKKNPKTKIVDRCLVKPGKIFSRNNMPNINSCILQTDTLYGNEDVSFHYILWLESNYFVIISYLISFSKRLLFEFVLSACVV